jgi:hypothetical protein
MTKNCRGFCVEDERNEKPRYEDLVVNSLAWSGDHARTSMVILSEVKNLMSRKDRFFADA